MTSVALISFLTMVSLLGSVLMALQLYRTGLYRRYPIFFVYFIFRIPNNIWPFFVDVSSGLYQQVWVLTEPIEVVFYVLMVVELYKLVLEKYKGLYSLGRWALYLSLAISVGISAITLLPRIKPSMAQRSKIMFYVMATERGIHTALAIFIIFILGFLSFFPVKLSRNVRVHALVFSIFFLSSTFMLLMRSSVRIASGGRGKRSANGHYSGQRGGLADAAATCGRGLAPFAGAGRAGVRKPVAGPPGFPQCGAAADFRPLEVILMLRFSTVLGNFPGNIGLISPKN